MRHLLILLWLCYNLTVSGTTYYISTSGSNSNNGSSGSPWATLAYACTRTTAGDVINVGVGTFNEGSNQAIVPAGVSIIGQGVTSIISYTYAGASETNQDDGCMILASGSGISTNGNQSISYLNFNGNNWTATRCLSVHFRNNVEIHHCTFTNFYYSGINFNGTTNGYPQVISTYHSTGNSIHDCTILNCSRTLNGDGGINGIYGQLLVGGQDGALIYNNTFDNTGITTNYMGDTWRSMLMKNCKFYNNVLSRNNDTSPWNFFSEFMETEGGLEVYGNTFNGNATLDIVDIRPGTSGFGCKIHNNTWQNTTQPALNSHGVQCIDFEERGGIQYCYVYNNHFKNTDTPIQFDAESDAINPKTLVSGNVTIDHCYVYYNLIENLGNTTNNYSIGISLKPYGDSYVYTTIFDNIYIDNNTIISGTTHHGYTGVSLETVSSMTNIYVRNNIIQGFGSYPILYSYAFGTPSGSTHYIQNNIFYNNNTNSVGFDGVTVSGINYTPTGGIYSTSNPLFVSASDFHLQPTSPAIGAGIHITTPPIATDVEGSAINNPPEIGAYKSGSAATLPAAPVYQSSAVANATPSVLEMTYNMPLANIVPSVSSFTVQVNSTARTFNGVGISGPKVQLTLTSRILPGDVVTVSYIKPSANPLQATSGGLAASISNQQVVNNCINTSPTAAIISPSPSSSFTSPANIAISANATDADGSVAKVEFYNGNTMLGSVSTPPFMFTWNNVAAGNYSLKCIATDNLGSKTTSSPILVSVIDSKHTPNRHPIVRISNPLKGNTYDNLSAIEIEAFATDSDGTVSRVEFYNGNTQLVEMTSAPYTYTWKDVPAGIYTITAVATDNMNDTTISSPVEFIVGNPVRYDPKSEIFNLYPNPNNGHFSIEFVNPLKSERNEIIISDLTGKQVYSGFIMKEDILKQFDISNIRSGMYVMLIKDKEILVTKKFIKQ